MSSRWQDLGRGSGRAEGCAQAFSAFDAGYAAGKDVSLHRRA